MRRQDGTISRLEHCIHGGKTPEVTMKALALGVLAAAGIAMATPAVAQGVYFGAGPGGIGVGVSPGYHDGYRRGYGSYGYDRGYRAYGYDRGSARCRTRLIETPYGVKRIQRCW